MEFVAGVVIEALVGICYIRLWPKLFFERCIGENTVKIKLSERFLRPRLCEEGDNGAIASCSERMKYFPPPPWKYTLLYGIQWDELMQMDCWPLSFGNPFRNLFNSLSKINPRAQNMSIRMEQKTTALRNRNTRRERKKEKNRTEGEREAHLIDALDRRSRSYRDRDTKIRGWTFDWWTDYISDPICIDYRGGRELPTILDVSIAIVRRVCTRSNADKIRRVNAIVFRKIDRGCCRFLCLI